MGRFKCEKCDKEFGNEKALEQHNADKHGSVSVQAPATPVTQQENQKYEFSSKGEPIQKTEKKGVPFKMDRRTKIGILVMIILIAIALVNFFVVTPAYLPM